jgi:hypothetical protein|eukprot:COSAG06_NODE_3379_length_5428_cov_5.607056_3_plen_46_part_00
MMMMMMMRMYVRVGLPLQCIGSRIAVHFVTSVESRPCCESRTATG